MSRLTNTRAALALFDEVHPLLFKAIVDGTNAEAEEACGIQDAYAEHVSRAFFEDTKDRNSLVNCLLLHPGRPSPAPGATKSFVRQMVELDIQAEAAGRRF